MTLTPTMQAVSAMARRPGRPSRPPREVIVVTPYRKARADALLAFHIEYLSSLLTKTKGVVNWAAELAKLDGSNFSRLLKRYGVEKENFLPPKVTDPMP